MVALIILRDQVKVARRERLRASLGNGADTEELEKYEGLTLMDSYRYALTVSP